MNVLTGFERLRVNNGRADREEMPPAEYLAAGYFERWVYSTERGLLENGVIQPGEVEAMMERLQAGEEVAPTSDPDQVARLLKALDDVPRLPDAVNPRFAVGDRVRVQRMRPPGHNRSPRYLRGVEGVVQRVQCNDRATRRGRGTRLPGVVRRRRRLGHGRRPRRDPGRPLGGVPGGRLLVDSVHDMGGMQGYGAAYWPGSEEPTHADWELRAFVLALVTGPGSSHAFRHTIERLDPVRYLSGTYYERWLYEAEQALVESGAITHEEVAAWERRLEAGEPMPRTSDAAGAARLVRALKRRPPLEPAADARFAPGDRVRVRRMRPAGHTRCPRYLRGARGTVARVQGRDGVPDVDNAETEAVYAVAFDSGELWGDDVGRHVVHADLWERYLEPDHV